MTHYDGTGRKHATPEAFLADVHSIVERTLVAVRLVVLHPDEIEDDDLDALQPSPCLHSFDAARGYLPPGFDSRGTCAICKRRVSMAEIVAALGIVVGDDFPVAGPPEAPMPTPRPAPKPVRRRKAP